MLRRLSPPTILRDRAFPTRCRTIKRVMTVGGTRPTICAVEIDSMITHILKLEDINKGFDLMHAGKSIRAVVVY